MKLLYENTKSCSGDLEQKITELKKIMAMQMNTLQSGVPLVGGGGLSGSQNMF